jgi:dipeptidyl aminopeptidase/acylaminoacyl peptidase
MEFIKSYFAGLRCLSTLITLLVFSPLAFSITPAQLAAEDIYQGAKISPDGKKLGMIIVKDGRRKLAVVKSSDFRPIGGVDFGDKQEVGNFYWANNERLVIEVWVNEPWDDRARFYGELYAIDYNGKRGEMIYGSRAGASSVGSKIKKKVSIVGWAEVINLLPDDEDNILISSQPQSSNGDRIATVHKLDIYSGKLSGIVAGGPVPAASFIADNKGDVKIAYGLDRDFTRRIYKFDSKSRDYSEIPNSDFGGGWRPSTIDQTGQYLFYIDDNEQDLEGLFKLNLETGEKTHIYTDDKVDITSINTTTDRSVAYAVRVDTDYPTYVMLDSENEEAKVFKSLLASFPGYAIQITSKSKDGNLWVIQASNDVSANAYYLYNRKKNKFSLLFANKADLNKQQLSQSIPISFPVSDGQTLHGYITYPAGIPETQSIPLVTLVHGGPHLRDYWEFDPEVQLLTSQGYAVLRVNYRGSRGYGTKFYWASNKQWGDRVQQDIIEGTKWVIQQGGILQDKVCIMGASFGGYSAVQSATLAPDLFKCAVATAGVYDIEMMFEEGDVQGRLWGIASLEQHHGKDPELMRRYSPVNNLDKLKAKLLIAHGGQDVRVPIEHAEALMKKLDAKGVKYDTFIKDNENHGFHNEQNRTEYYQKVVAFLAKHLK